MPPGRGKGLQMGHMGAPGSEVVPALCSPRDQCKLRLSRHNEEAKPEVPTFVPTAISGTML